MGGCVGLVLALVNGAAVRTADEAEAAARGATLVRLLLRPRVQPGAHNGRPERVVVSLRREGFEQWLPWAGLENL